MKKWSLILGSVLALAISFTACDNDKLSIGEPFSKLEGINDSWRLSKVIMDDKLKSPTAADRSLDVSDLVVGTNPAEVTFNSSDFTFVASANDSKNYFGATSGTWAFDNNDYPTTLSLTSGGNTLVFALLRTIRISDNQLEIELVRTCNGNAGIGYQLTFDRI